MSTEVEIKFVVNPQVKLALQSLLQHHVVIEHAIKPLSNTYFDTTTYQFRQFDFGLRTRKSLDFAEQTIKTAGSVSGGLHQRPEYNLPLFGDQPTLAAFPAEIWPEKADLAQLQADLIALFSTDFERTLWHIQLPNGAEVEVVFDQGMVRSGDHSYPICEIELELISGEVDDLFSLAQEIVQLGGVRLGNVSKAKRGYQLAGLYTPVVKPLQLNMPSVPDETLADVFLETLVQSYAHWQYHEQLYLETEDIHALAQMLAGVELIQQTMQTYAEIFPDIAVKQTDLVWLQQQLAPMHSALQLQQVVSNNGHFIRNFPEHKRILKELSELQASYLNFAEVETLVNSPRYAALMLCISQLICHGKLELLTPAEWTVQEFSNRHLEESWQNVLHSPLSRPRLGVDDYLQLKCKLQQNLLIGHCFSHHYAAKARDKFRLPWQDIVQGTEDLEVVQMLKGVAEHQPPAVAKQINKILVRKRNSLLDALEQTRHQALTMQPYWL